MRVLVTGSSGLIGPETVCCFGTMGFPADALAGDGMTAACISRKPPMPAFRNANWTCNRRLALSLPHNVEERLLRRISNPINA